MFLPDLYSLCLPPFIQFLSSKGISDGVFFAELKEVLTIELAEDGCSGVEIGVTPIIIWATHPHNILGKKGTREFMSVVQKRFKIPKNSMELYAKNFTNRGLCTIDQAKSLRYKLSWCPEIYKGKRSEGL
ncbi:hypothetical protein NE237_031862 [Protea cynaroides]|uniref:Uncharacterized protein n=1 Tax=Protea cynaroides TaxID=273540 RepID=A0A9Q0R2J0_9MAGN|nr:hypothetical protein NE237_031862 [Protea cynaroides]